MNEIDVCIIGGGAAGMAAALGAYENGAKNVLLIERAQELGGVLNQCIHNGFGLHYFKEELTGPSYSERFIKVLDETNIEVKLETTVVKITKDKAIHYMNSREGYRVIKPKTIILSLGCRERTRHQIDILGSRCAGIYTAGSAQKYVNIDGYLVGKNVFILGSGDIGLIMARRMKLEGANVLGVAEIMPYSNGLTRNIVQCLDDYDIPLYLSHTVTNISGNGRLEEITIAKVDERFNVIPGTEKHFMVDTLLLSIGLIPENDLLSNLDLEMNLITQGPMVNSRYETTLKGLYACGNSLHVHDLVDYVSLEGYLAGKYAIESLSNNHIVDSNIRVLPKNNVRYVVPNYISNQLTDDILLKFRVVKPIENGKIIVKTDHKIIKEIKRNHLIPSEMEMIELNKELIEKLESDSELTVEVI